MLTHGYTSNHHMIGRPGSTLAEGLWNSLVGPEKAVDTDRLFVVSSNMLGSSCGSTGPAHPDPATGRPYGPDFPDFTDGIVPVTTDIKARDDGMARINALIALGRAASGLAGDKWAPRPAEFLSELTGMG